MERWPPQTLDDGNLRYITACCFTASFNAVVGFLKKIINCVVTYRGDKGKKVILENEAEHMASDLDTEKHMHLDFHQSQIMS